jgi:pimeloyl-ACP methyl ester carboxylesterase
MQEAGIKYVYEGKRSYGMPVDAVRSGTTLRYRGAPTDEDWTILGMERNPSSQFNMIGYSYGSLLAAQTAYFYASNGHVVDHLALVGSPISEEFLDELKRCKNIKKIIVTDLKEYGDPIFAGMSQIRLFITILKLKKQMSETLEKKEGVGHFYYATATPEGNRRRRELAGYLFRQGIR